jgi:ABC-type glycerol-3-phosphate transport system permease component
MIHGTGLRDTLRHGVRRVLIAVAVLCSLAPFYKMVLGSFQPPDRIIGGLDSLVPGGELSLHNYSALFDQLPIGRNVLNSLIVATLSTATTLVVSVLAGYAFAKHEFRGKSLLFALVLGTIALPITAVIIPLFLQMRDLGWLNSYQALVLPLVANGFGIFWMRQYIAGAVPDELLDAARLDGASELLIVRRIVVPLVRPGLAALACLWFMSAWNDYLWPLMATSTDDMFTVPVAVGSMVGLGGGLRTLGSTLAAASIGVAPLLFLFFLLRKQFVAGLVEGAVK